MGQIGKGLEYVKSIPCILKIIEFVILLISIGTVGYFLNNVLDNFFIYADKKGNLQFFMFVVVVGWLLVIALFSLFIIGLHEKVAAINWSLTVAIISAVWTVLLLISSALVADAARHYDSKKTGAGVDLCKWLDLVKADSRCGHLIGGAICGFAAMILFALDTLIHFRMFVTRESAPKPSVPAVAT